MMNLLSKVFDKKVIIGTLFLILTMTFYVAFADPESQFGSPSQAQESINKQIERYKDSSPVYDVTTRTIFEQIFGIIPQLNLDSGQIVLQTAFYGFNIGVAALGAALVVFAVFLGLSNTVSSGQPLGQRLHTMFFPLRIAIGSVSLAPIYGGYNLAQLFSLWCIIQGTHFADLIWNMSMRAYLNSALTENTDNSNNQGADENSSNISQSNITSLIQALNLKATNSDIMCQQFTGFVARDTSDEVTTKALNLAYSKKFNGLTFSELYRANNNIMCKNITASLSSDPCAALISRQNPAYTQSPGEYQGFYQFCETLADQNSINRYNSLFLNALDMQCNDLLTTSFDNIDSPSIKGI